ncbi:nitroreductase/quinone reductase family protein [Plantactinospora sp. GCM10030261]|uniref:nitroreductase/quinone reductase family protein n=1 Tax=Plantactinospora sp. GCM10030261 TaxID=3273420 RepID=UPI003623B5FA
MPNDFNQQIIDEFRANGGRVGGYFQDARLILLTTTGARTGRPHTTPVAYLPDTDRIVVIASAAGSPRHPAWFHNLVANPTVTVENGVVTYQAEATVLTGAERDEVFARAVEADPGWADYQAKTDRQIPVVALRQVSGGPPRASSLGAALRLIHDAFRRELALVRAEAARSGPRLGAQLRINCLALCANLEFHHTAEDGGMFPAIGERHPELRPVLDRLAAEHLAIAALVEELRALLAADDADPSRLARDVDRLTAELDRHLTYEEERLIPALDAVPG